MADQPQQSVEIRGEIHSEYHSVLTPEAIDFLVHLERFFREARQLVLTHRRHCQASFAQGKMPDFLPDTATIRDAEWHIGPSPIPHDLQDRRVEITAPPERKMMIDAMNSGAQVCVADFEDALTPTWDNLIQGQINIRDAHDNTIVSQEAANLHQLHDDPATLAVCPRGWHFPEKHVWVDGAPMSGALFDFGLYFFTNLKYFQREGYAAYLYLPKLESHLEARLWNDVFVHAEDTLLMPRGKVKATVLIETLPAVFEMDEIIYELREHLAGLKCGYSDYIFNYMKIFQHSVDRVLPDHNQLAMTCHFLRSYSQLLIKTCHRRRAYAIGGMAAQLPIKDDPTADEEALARVRADKEREMADGYDGTGVAHPGLVSMASEAFISLLNADSTMKQEEQHRQRVAESQDPFQKPFGEGVNQLHQLLEDLQVSASDLLTMPEGSITEAGFCNNIRVGLRYLAAWLNGEGYVPINNLMEDAATAEIARTQLWQWLHHGAQLDDGRPITKEWFMTVLEEEQRCLRQTLGEQQFTERHLDLAGELLTEVCTATELADFLTLVAYEHI